MSEEQVIEEHRDVEHQRINDVARKFVDDLEEERQRLGDQFPLCTLLIDEALQRILETGRIPGREFYADVYKQKPLKITQKVFVPVKQFPKFNFTGKILGPKGNSLRRLQDETQCKIAIKGRNSIRDPAKEEELRNGNDPRFAHLNKNLFVEISTIATPAESYARMAYALAEVRKYLVPDKNDEVSHDQMRELLEIDPKKAKMPTGEYQSNYKSKSMFERKFTTTTGALKYLSLIRDNKHEHEVEEFEHPYVERTVPSHYEARTVPYKRQQPTSSFYPTEIKRVRETPVRSYKPSSYAILKRYK